MLHNMLLEFDGLDDFSWDDIDPDGELQEDELIAPNTVVQENDNVVRVPVLLDLNNHRPTYVRYSPGNYDVVREAIKVHFNRQYNQGNDYMLTMLHFNLTVIIYYTGLCRWPNRANDHLKSKFPNQRDAIVARLNEEHERVLYVQESTLRAFHPLSKLPTVLIGEGLFARIVIQNGAHIADYNGDLISVDEAELRNDRGQGGYMIYINDTTRLDCYDKCRRGLCKASKAKSNTS